MQEIERQLAMQRYAEFDFGTKVTTEQSARCDALAANLLSTIRAALSAPPLSSAAPTEPRTCAATIEEPLTSEYPERPHRCTRHAGHSGNHVCGYDEQGMSCGYTWLTATPVSVPPNGTTITTAPDAKVEIGGMGTDVEHSGAVPLGDAQPPTDEPDDLCQRCGHARDKHTAIDGGPDALCPVYATYLSSRTPPSVSRPLAGPTNAQQMVDRSWGKVPRRICLDLHTPAEKAIRDAVDAVENAGAHPLLTHAINLLGQAREKVADYVELGVKGDGID